MVVTKVKNTIDLECGKLVRDKISNLFFPNSGEDINPLKVKMKRDFHLLQHMTPEVFIEYIGKPALTTQESLDEMMVQLGVMHESMKTNTMITCAKFLEFVRAYYVFINPILDAEQINEMLHYVQTGEYSNAVDCWNVVAHDRFEVAAGFRRAFVQLLDHAPDSNEFVKIVEEEIKPWTLSVAFTAMKAPNLILAEALDLFKKERAGFYSGFGILQTSNVLGNLGNLEFMTVDEFWAENTGIDSMNSDNVHDKCVLDILSAIKLAMDNSRAFDLGTYLHLCAQLYQLKLPSANPNAIAQIVGYIAGEQSNIISSWQQVETEAMKIQAEFANKLRLAYNVLDNNQPPKLATKPAIISVIVRA
jgi:hypothetical protein